MSKDCDKEKRRLDDKNTQPTVDEILVSEGIPLSGLKEYENYSMFYRALQAVLKHQRPSQETVRRFEIIEGILEDHVRDEMIWKNDVLKAIKDQTLSIGEMKPTVKRVSDIETFISVGNHIGWMFLILLIASFVGLYHFGKDLIAGFK